MLNLQTEINPDIPINAAGEYEFEFTPGEIDHFKEKEDLTVSEHAEKYRVVTRGPSPGQWSNSLTPYLVFPMDLWNVPWIRKIILCFPPQVGKTQVAFNCLNYVIDQDPDAAFYVMSDEKRAGRISKRQIIPFLESSPMTAEKMSSRADDTSKYYIQFNNGMDLMLAWATSPASLASESARYMFFDEIDKYAELALDFGDQRTNTYPWTSKQLYFSSPEEYGKPLTQLITREAEVLYQLHAKCPMCGHEQRMIFDQIKWPKDIRDPRKIERRKLARYICEKCSMGWDDGHRDQAVRNGTWVPYHIPGKWPDGVMVPMAEAEIERFAVVAVQMGSWYSHFISLSKVAGAFLRGLKSADKLRTFITQHKALPWKQTVKTTEADELLKARVKDLPAQVIPDAAMALTCGIDVQKAGFWFTVRAWASDYSSWLIHYGYLTSWAEIEDLLYVSKYPWQSEEIQAERGPMGIWRAGFDIGGGKYKEEISSTEEVYFWIIQHRHRPGPKIWATKGSSRHLPTKLSIGKPLEKTRSGRSIPGGIQIVSLDTTKFKDNYHYRLEKAISGEDSVQAAFLHSETAMDYARQIMAEQKEKQKNGVEEWVRIQKDNHLLDCEVIAHALADHEWPGGGVHILGQKKQSPKSKPKPGGSGKNISRTLPSWRNKRRS